MSLIKNKDMDGYTLSKEQFCSTCFNRGWIRVPADGQNERFEEEFDRLDAVGVLPHNECYDRAVEKCVYDTYYCPYCEKGQKYKDRYPVYKKNTIKNE